MKTFGLKAALLALALLPSAALAQGCVESTGEQIIIAESGGQYRVPEMANYTANIAKRDLFNSRNVRLGTVAAVLQQDRANYHKTGFGDGTAPFYDTGESYFTSLARRSKLANATYYADCYMSGQQVQAQNARIINGQVQGVLWIVLFNSPRGGLGVYVSEVN